MDKFEFVDGNKPDSRAPRLMLWIDAEGPNAAIRVKHEGDRSDQHLISIEQMDEGEPLSIRIRELYPERAPRLCAAFGIETEDCEGGRLVAETGAKFGRPIVLASNPDPMSPDRSMIIAEDGEPDREGFLQRGEISLDGIRKALAAFIEPDESSAEEYAEKGDGENAGAIYDFQVAWARNIRAGAADRAIRELFRPHQSDAPDRDPAIEAGLKREREMIRAMGKANAAAKALLDEVDPEGRYGESDDLEEAIAEQRALIERAEGKSEDADAPASIEQIADERGTASFGGLRGNQADRIILDDPHAEPFKIATGDPEFDPMGPVEINGTRFTSDKARAAFREAIDPGLSISSSIVAGRLLGERMRQISEEGWTPEHDDMHGDCEIAAAAACYALASCSLPNDAMRPGQRNAQEARVDAFRDLWPWDEEWWKPGPPIRDLERAGALIIAEIERRLRAGEGEG